MSIVRGIKNVAYREIKNIAYREGGRPLNIFLTQTQYSLYIAPHWLVETSCYHIKNNIKLSQYADCIK